MTSPVFHENIPRLQMVEMAVFSSASLTSSFQGMNLAANYAIYTGNGFQYPVKMIQVYNGGTTGITVSFDGVTQNAYWPPGATLILDCQTNHADNSSYASGALNGAQGQILYGKGTAGSGSIYIMGYL